VSYSVLLSLLSFFPLFLRIDIGRFFSVSSNLELFEPSYVVYVAACAVAITACALSRSRNRMSQLLSLWALAILLFYMVPLAMSMQNEFALIIYEPRHLSGAIDILLTAHVNSYAFYSSWPGLSILLSALAAAMGVRETTQLIAVAFGLSILLIILMITIEYIVGQKLLGHGYALVSLHLLAGFYFIYSGLAPAELSYVLFLVFINLFISRDRSLARRTILILLTLSISITNVVTSVALVSTLGSFFLLQAIRFRVRDPALYLVATLCGLGWSIYQFTSFPELAFGNLIATFQWFSGMALGSAPPSAIVPWYVTIAKDYRFLANLTVLFAAAGGATYLLLHEKSMQLQRLVQGFLGMILCFSIAQVAFLSIEGFASFWQRQAFLFYPFLCFFALAPFSRKKAVLVHGVGLCLLIVLSFLATNAPLNYPYVHSDYSTGVFLSDHIGGSQPSIGSSLEFDKLLLLVDPSIRLPHSVVYVHLETDLKYYRERLVEDPSLYGTTMIVRTKQDVATFYDIHGLSYSDYWGKVDGNLQSLATYNRLSDSGSQQIFLQT
jgi:hypothetical protein